MKRFSNLLFRSALTGLLAIGLMGPLLTGCATTTSGPTVNAGPVLSQLVGSNVLMDDPGVLMLYATTDCNVGAAQEFRLSVAACSGGLAGLTPGLVVPANLQSGIQTACQVLGYTDSKNQLLAAYAVTVTPGPPAACLNPPAPPTPAGMKMALHH